MRCDARDYGETTFLHGYGHLYPGLDLGFLGVDRFLFGMEMDQERGSGLSASRGEADSTVGGCPEGGALSLDRARGELHRSAVALAVGHLRVLALAGI